MSILNNSMILLAWSNK